jgi:hypothetical protein
MTVIKRSGGIRAFLVERYLPIYPIYLTLWVVAVESITTVVTDSAGPMAPDLGHRVEGAGPDRGRRLPADGRRPEGSRLRRPAQSHPFSESGLVCSGPYRVLRHPAYAGMLLANIGFVSYFASPASIVALTLLAATILWRIRVEEAVLVRSPGYREFASTRRRFVPGVW